jgi:O-antigen/teichoic acid export membrane protein
MTADGTRPSVTMERGAAEGAGATPERRPSVLRNMGHMMYSQVASWILGTVAQILSARFLGPEALGQLRLAFSVWLIAQILITLGTSTYLTLEMARDPQHGSKIIGPILLLRLAAFAIASTMIATYAIIAGHDLQFFLLLAVVGSTILLMALADTFSSALVGLEQMAYPAMAGVIAKTAYTAVLIAILLMGSGVIGVAAATAFNALLNLLLLRHFLRRFATPKLGLRGSISIVRKSSGFLTASAIVVVYLQIDTLVIATLVDEETLGWYATADLMAGSMLFVPSIMMATLFPVLGRLHDSDTSAEAGIVRRAFSVLFLSGIAIGFGIIVVAEPVCVLLFGESFRPSGAVLAVLGLMMPFIFSTMMVATVAMATGMQRFWNIVMTVAVLLTIALDLVFVPWMDRLAGNGAIGGAMSYVMTEAFMLAVGVWKVVPVVRTHETVVRLLKTCLAGLLMVAVAWPLRQSFVLLPVFLGAIVFSVSIVVLGVLSMEEREIIGRLLGRIGLRPRRRLVPEATVLAPTPAAAEVEDREEGGTT